MEGAHSDKCPGIVKQKCVCQRRVYEVPTLEVLGRGGEGFLEQGAPKLGNTVGKWRKEVPGRGKKLIKEDSER